MNDVFMTKLEEMLSSKPVSNPLSYFSVNLMLDDAQVISVSTLQSEVKIVNHQTEGDTVARMSSQALCNVLNGQADLQGLYLNGQIQVDGNVMDVIRLRDFLK